MQINHSTTISPIPLTPQQTLINLPLEQATDFDASLDSEYENRRYLHGTASWRDSTVEDGFRISGAKVAMRGYLVVVGVLVR